MAQSFLILVILAGHLHASIRSVPELPQLFLMAAFGYLQTDPPLDLSQIERLLDLKAGDEGIAREIRKRGIGFRVDSATLDRLLKLGAGEQIRRALLQQEERAAYAEFSNEKNPAKRLALGQEFLRKHSLSPEAARVTAELRKVELEIFESAYRTFSDNPDASGLDQVLKLGRDLLNRQSDRATEAQVTSKLALATGKGMIGNFYSDLEQSRAYADQSLRLLEDTSPPPGMDQQSYNQLRATSLSLVYQSLGIYQLRQPEPNSEQAINYLTKAAELKDGAAANDPITYWLRADARDLDFQKLSDEYRALPKDQRAGRQGQSLCARITALVNQLILDYTQVIALSSRANSSQLRDEAVAAMTMLATGDRPCLGGRGGLIDELPSEENRSALVIGVEDYLDKQIGKFNYADSDARAVADALIRHGGFRKEQVVLLATGETGERQPQRNLILRQLAELPNRVKQDGLLLVYFAGHAFESGGKNYLLASDSFTNNESLLADTAINIEQFKERIKASGAGQIMLIFESFRRAPLSETFSRQLSFDTRKNEVTAFATLLSTRVGQHAHESTVRKQGYFTSILLEAAKGKAASNNRGVTLDDLIKYLKTTVPQEAQRELGAGVQQSPSAVVEGYEEEDLVMFLPDSGGQPSAQAANQNLAELVRSSKTILIHPKTGWFNADVLKAELSKLPEFQVLNLKIVNDANEADLVIEVRLPPLTWMWNYTIIHRSSNKLLASGKVRGLTDGTISPRLAKELVTKLQALRDQPQR
ncbi:MAG: caspase domain-containing protein [Blastocatellales bacterium]